jgi:hypothetical protein
VLNTRRALVLFLFCLFYQEAPSGCEVSVGAGEVQGGAALGVEGVDGGLKGVGIVVGQQQNW